MKSDLTKVFKSWFEVAATPIDMAANAVKQVTQNHIQPFVDKADKNLQKQMDIINTAHPGLLHAVREDTAELKNKFDEAIDTTVDYSEAVKVPAFPILALDDIPGYEYIPAADDIPGVQRIKELTGLEDKKKPAAPRGRHRRAAAPAAGGGKRRRKRRRKKRTKKRALKKRHRRRKTRRRR